MVPHCSALFIGAGIKKDMAGNMVVCGSLEANMLSHYNIWHRKRKVYQTVCREYNDKTLKNIASRHIQSVEIWSFGYSKEKDALPEKQGKFGCGDDLLRFSGC